MRLYLPIGFLIERQLFPWITQDGEARVLELAERAAPVQACKTVRNLWSI